MSAIDSSFWAGLWIGLLLAVPVGPIGVLVIQRSLNHGAATGLATGLGAAAADALYGAAGAWGASTVVSALQQLRVPLLLAGGGYLLWLAWRGWQHRPATLSGPVVVAPGLWSCGLSTLVLTLANPATVLTFIAIFSTWAARSTGPFSAPWMVLGVGLGSALWWLLLSTVVGELRRRLSVVLQRRLSQISALMLAGFALWSWSALMR